MSKKNYTVEFATTEDFAFDNRAGFTTGSVNDPQIKRMFDKIVAAVEAGQIVPVEAGSDEKFTVIPVCMRVRRSDPANRADPHIPGVDLGDSDLI